MPVVGSSPTLSTIAQAFGRCHEQERAPLSDSSQSGTARPNQSGSYNAWAGRLIPAGINKSNRPRSTFTGRPEQLAAHVAKE